MAQAVDGVSEDQAQLPLSPPAPLVDSSTHDTSMTVPQKAFLKTDVAQTRQKYHGNPSPQCHHVRAQVGAIITQSWSSFVCDTGA